MKRVYILAAVCLVVWCFPVFAAPPQQCANGQCARVASVPRAVGAVAKSKAVTVTSHRRTDRPVLKLFRPFKGRGCGC